MVEKGQFPPRLGRVATFAAGDGSVGAGLLHAFVKLSLVRILVAGRASEIFPVIEDNRFGRSLRVLLLLVAIATGDGNVPARQNKVRFFVPG